MSHYQKGTIRGLHLQKGTVAKLIRVIQGEVIDVAVDCRLGSPSCGSYVAIFYPLKIDASFGFPRDLRMAPVLSDFVF